jgi:ribonuclease P protein component
MSKYTFGKEEKLKKEKDIQELFAKGSYFYLYPFKVYYSHAAIVDASPNKVLISVSKKNFKRAVDRNLLKRRIREAYRLQKNLLSPSSNLHLGFIYTQKEILLFNEIKNKLAQALSRINKISNNPTQLP